MKKIIGSVILGLFLISASASVYAADTSSKMEVVDLEKCPKCNSEDCDGKCDVKKQEAKKEGCQTQKPCDKAKKSCCDSKKKAEQDKKK